MSIWLYRITWLFLWPLILLFLLWRAITGKEKLKRLPERFGLPSQRKSDSPVVWIHGASVGECISILPLIEQILAQDPKMNVLVTSGTRTSAKMMVHKLAELSPEGRAFHQMIPLDFWPFVMLFLNYWKPALSVFVESEFWPECIHSAKPILLNARISDRSFPRYQKLSWFFKPLLSRIPMALAQREEDAKRLKALGVKDASAAGNLKFDAPPLPVDEEELTNLLETVGSRPVLAITSTHLGEDELAVIMHKNLKEHVPNLLTILVPRHPERGPDLAKKLKCPLRSAKESISTSTDLYVADTLGELGLWYRLCNLTVVAGSLLPIGGHNPLEPLKLSTVTLTGPYMFNFKDMVPTLTDQGLLTIAKDMGDLEKHVLHYLTQPQIRAAKGEEIEQKN